MPNIQSLSGQYQLCARVIIDIQRKRNFFIIAKNAICSNGFFAFKSIHYSSHNLPVYDWPFFIGTDVYIYRGVFHLKLKTGTHLTEAKPFQHFFAKLFIANREKLRMCRRNQSLPVYYRRPGTAKFPFAFFNVHPDKRFTYTWIYSD